MGRPKTEIGKTEDEQTAEKHFNELANSILGLTPPTILNELGIKNAVGRLNIAIHRGTHAFPKNGTLTDKYNRAFFAETSTEIFPQQSTSEGVARSVLILHSMTRKALELNDPKNSTLQSVAFTNALSVVDEMLRNLDQIFDKKAGRSSTQTHNNLKSNTYNSTSKAEIGKVKKDLLMTLGFENGKVRKFDNQTQPDQYMIANLLKEAAQLAIEEQEKDPANEAKRTNALLYTLAADAAALENLQQNRYDRLSTAALLLVLPTLGIQAMDNLPDNDQTRIDIAENVLFLQTKILDDYEKRRV